MVPVEEQSSSSRIGNRARRLLACTPGKGIGLEIDYACEALSCSLERTSRLSSRGSEDWYDRVVTCEGGVARVGDTSTSMMMNVFSMMPRAGISGSHVDFRLLLPNALHIDLGPPPSVTLTS